MTTSPMSNKFQSVNVKPIPAAQVRAAALTTVELLIQGGATSDEVGEALTMLGIGLPELRRGMFYEGSSTSQTIARSAS